LRNEETYRADPVPTKRLRYTNHFSFLPDEILVYIFSFLPHEQLYKNVKPVCKRWNSIVSTPTLWKKILADKNIPTNILCRWLEHSPLLEHVCFVDRDDMNLIADKVGKCNPNLKRKVLCSLIKRCKKLNQFIFSQTTIRSSKFFKMIGSKEEAQRKCSYSGPISLKQIHALVESAIQNESYSLSTLRSGTMFRNSLTNLLAQPQVISNALMREIWDEILNMHLREEPALGGGIIV
ncbi:hypothetical protein GWI33_021637, partial [Rhynchophorus ferrugineus]